MFKKSDLKQGKLEEHKSQKALSVAEWFPSYSSVLSTS